MQPLKKTIRLCTVITCISLVVSNTPVFADFEYSTIDSTSTGSITYRNFAPATNRISSRVEAFHEPDGYLTGTSGPVLNNFSVPDRNFNHEGFAIFQIPAMPANQTFRSARAQIGATASKRDPRRVLESSASRSVDTYVIKQNLDFLYREGQSYPAESAWLNFQSELNEQRLGRGIAYSSVDFVGTYTSIDIYSGFTQSRAAQAAIRSAYLEAQNGITWWPNAAHVALTASLLTVGGEELAIYASGTETGWRLNLEMETCDFVEGNFRTKQFAANQWHLVSLPCDLRYPVDSVTNTLGDDVPGVYGEDWIVFAYNAATNAYYAPAADDFLPTNFWFIHESNGPVDIDLPPSAAPRNAELLTSTEYSGNFNKFECSSNRGCIAWRPASNLPAFQWNIKGTYLQQTVAFNDMKVSSLADGLCSDRTGCSVDANNSQTTSLIVPVFFGYDSDTGSYFAPQPGDRLQPWQGFWVGFMANAYQNTAAVHLPLGQSPFTYSR